jgi:hypothetical protein
MRSVEVLVQKHGLFIEQAIRTRLYDKGTYADGKQIKTYRAQGSDVYSPFTIQLKKQEGQPTDRVTLKNEGELYESFNVKTESSGFAVEFEDDKEDGKVSDNIPDMDRAIELGGDGLKDLQSLIIKDLQDDFIKEAKEAILYGVK